MHPCFRVLVAATLLMLAAAIATAEPTRNAQPTKGAGGARTAPRHAVTVEQRQHTRTLADKLNDAASARSPSPSAIAAVLDAPLQYAGIVFFRDACKKKFAETGKVARPQLMGFAACVPDSNLAHCDVLIEDEAAPDFSDMTPPPCLVRLASGLSGRRLITSMRVEGIGMGIEGGIVGGPGAPSDAAPPPPPPPPPPPRTTVPAAEIRQRLVAGTLDVPPDRATQDAIAQAGVRRVEAEARVCFTPRGAAFATEMLRSTGYPAWDEAIRNAMLACTIRPAADGPAGQVCAKIPFTYQR